MREKMEINLADKIKQRIEYTDLELTIGAYSSETIFKKGKEYLDKENYCSANLCFKELAKEKQKKEIYELYLDLNFVCNQLSKSFRISLEQSNLYEKNVEKTIKRSMIYYQQQKISKEEILEIEKWINGRVACKINLRKNRIYDLFVNYIADNFFS